MKLESMLDNSMNIMPEMEQTKKGNEEDDYHGVIYKKLLSES